MGIGRNNIDDSINNGGNQGMELTGKEIEIIELIGEGCTNEQIGEKTNYTIPSIKKKVGKLLKKFKVQNRAALYKSYLSTKQ